MISESGAAKEEEDTALELDGQDHNKMLPISLAIISKDIKDLKQEISSCLPGKKKLSKSFFKKNSPR